MQQLFQEYQSFICIIVKDKKIRIIQDQHGTIPILFSENQISIQQYFIGQQYLKPGITDIILKNNLFHIVATKYYDLSLISSENLLSALQKSAKQIVTAFNEITLLFSAGIDSMILFLLLKEEILLQNKTLLCITLNCENIPSEDAQIVQKFIQTQNNSKNIIFETKTLNKQQYISSPVQKLLEPLTPNIMNYNLASVIHFATSSQKVAISGLGPDEYLQGYAKSTPREQSISNIYLRNCGRDFRVANSNNCRLICPYLSLEVTKIFMASEGTDKAILRQLGRELGLDEEFSGRKKRAAQFGSGISKFIKGEGYDKVDQM